MSSAAIYEAVDERTREILQLRRQAPGYLRRRGWLVRRALLAADIFALTLAFVLAEELFGPTQGVNGRFGGLAEDLLFALSLPVWVVAAKLYGLYDRDEERTDHSTIDDFSGVLHLVTLVTWLLVVTAYLTPVADPQVPKLFVFWLAAVTGVPLARAAGRAFCRRQIQYLQNTVIVGAGEVGQELARRLIRHPEYGLNLVGFVDSLPREQEAGLEHVALLGNLDSLPEVCDTLDVERVIFAFTLDDHESMLQLVRDLNEARIQVDIVPRLFEVVGPAVGIHSIEGIPVIGLPPVRLSRSSSLIKRGMDICVSAVLLVVLSPVFLVVAIAIKLDSPGPVFFRQIRAGRGDELFRIWKFRTMVPDAEERKDALRHLNVHALNGGDAKMFKLVADPRVTALGHFLRRTSIDELPQLINVFVGQMSLVGPRPLILEEDRHVENWGRRRLDLRPGMTGLWQVLGRSEIPFVEMVRIDYLYVTGWSVLGDLQLILRTFPLFVRSHRGAV